MDERDRVALRVDDREVARVTVVLRDEGPLEHPRAAEVDLGPAPGGVILPDQLLERPLHERGIARVAVPVLEGELLRLDREVHPVRTHERQFPEVEALEQVELREEQEPLRDRRGLVDPEASVVRGDRRVDEGLVHLAGEVAWLEGRALPVEEVEEPFGELPTIEGLGAVVSHGAKASREIGRRPALAWRGWSSTGQELARGIGESLEDLRPLADPAADPAAYRDAVLRELDRGSPELRPRAGPPALPHGLVEGNRARHRDRVDALEGHRAALGHVTLPRRAGSRHAAAVQPHDLAPAGVVDDGEPVAAQAAHHGEQHPFRRRDRDRRVEGVAAPFEGSGADRGRSRVGGRDHAPNPEGLREASGRGRGTPGAVVGWTGLAHAGHSTRHWKSRRAGRPRRAAPRPRPAASRRRRPPRPRRARAPREARRRRDR